MTKQECSKYQIKTIGMIIGIVFAITASINVWGISQSNADMMKMEQSVTVSIEKMHAKFSDNQKSMDMRIRFVEQSDAVNTERFRSIQLDLVEIKKEIKTTKGK